MHVIITNQWVWKCSVFGSAYTAPSDSVGTGVYCRWICMNEFDGLVRDMLDELRARRFITEI